MIDLTKVKHNYCIVVARTEECIKFFPNLCTINIGDLYQHCPIDSVSSGYSILLLACAKQVSSNEQHKKWDEKDFILLKRCKQNTLKKNNNHYESVGHYFSFGNKADFQVKMIILSACIQLDKHMGNMMKMILLSLLIVMRSTVPTN